MKMSICPFCFNLGRKELFENEQEAQQLLK